MKTTTEKSIREQLILVKLIGESLRELAVLILVFVPLETLLQSNERRADFHYASWTGGRLDWLPPSHAVALFCAVLAIPMLYYGIKMETNATVDLEEGDDNDTSNGTV
jgi:hypothetical protein